MNNKKYLITEKEEKQLKVKSHTRKFLQISNRNETPLNIQNIRDLSERLIAQSKSSNKRLILYVSGPNQALFNIKAMNEDDINIEDLEDYLSGRVKDATKFMNSFFTLNAVIIE